MDHASDRPVRRPSEGRRTGAVPSHAVLAGVILLVGIGLLWTAIGAADGDFDAQGPRLAPVIVTAAWVAVAAVYLVMQFLPGRRVAEAADHAETPAVAAEAPAETTEEGEAATGRDGVGWLAPLGVVAALVGFAIALEYAGFVVSAALFFLATARVLGSRNLVRDTIVAIVLPVAIYLAFTRLLDLFLPAGVFPL